MDEIILISVTPNSHTNNYHLTLLLFFFSTFTDFYTANQNRQTMEQEHCKLTGRFTHFSLKFILMGCLS